MRNPLSLEAFADWCERKPADEEYEYREARNCACGQYAKFIGLRNWSIFDVFWYEADLESFLASPRTFGALAARLREASKATGDA